MKEDCVSISTAKLAKEKGFNEHCKYIYKKQKGSKIYILTYSVIRIKNSELIRRNKPMCAPTYDLLAKWLRDKKHLLITIFSKSQESWQFHITRPGQGLEDTRLYKDFSSYDEALRYAIQECLEKFIKIVDETIEETESKMEKI